MTETVTVTGSDVFRTKQNFSDYVEKHSENIIKELAQENDKIFLIPQITQQQETIFDILKYFRENKNGTVFWFIHNEREELIKVSKQLNTLLGKGQGIFIIKTFLNDDKIEFECILKSEHRNQRVKNDNTPAKALQKNYWEQYSEKCDELMSEMQVIPSPRHYQYISSGIVGTQIMQTINTQDKFVATELFIPNNKSIFDKLYENKAEIEKELGNLQWQRLDGKKSARIRKTYPLDMTDSEKLETTIKEHINMAEALLETFDKYLHEV